MSFKRSNQRSCEIFLGLNSKYPDTTWSEAPVELWDPACMLLLTDKPLSCLHFPPDPSLQARLSQGDLPLPLPPSPRLSGRPDVPEDSRRFLTVTVNSCLQEKGKVGLRGTVCSLRPSATFNLPSKLTHWPLLLMRSWAQQHSEQCQTPFIFTVRVSLSHSSLQTREVYL